MNNLTQQTLFQSDFEDSKLAQLKQLYPNCFNKRGEFLIDKFNEIIQSLNIPINQESYSLQWLGKSYAKILQRLPPETLLKEDIIHNSKPENKNSQNLLIKGDNIEVLKHLKSAYAEKVKMIYIDPPYNTGSDDFVYQDNRKFTAEQLAELGNMDLDAAQRVLDFTAKKSSSHSAWLTFMYPRLYIARELLREDGVIFISIDDNEQAQLKILCDEVFGEENFYGMATWSARTKAMNAGAAKFKPQISDEYILIYGKINVQKHSPFNLEIKDKKSYDYESENGSAFRIEEIQQRKNTGIKRSEKMVFPILGIYPKSGNRWTIGKNTARNLEKEKNVFVKNNVVYRKIFESEEKNDSHYPLWINFSDTVGTSESGKSLVLNLLEKEHGFETIKPVELLEKLIFHFSCDNDLIIDFFAGSGTTAHAIFNFNYKNKEYRKFILVQLPEQTKKDGDAFRAGYKNIFEITKERIEKSAVKIREEFPNFNGDLGFKIFETVPDFRTPILENSQTEMYPIPHFFADQIQTLLTTWRLYDGQPLTENIRQINLDNYTAYLGKDTLYLLYPEFNSNHIKALIEMLDNTEEYADFSPTRIVLHGDLIESSKQKELAQAVQTYANKKSISILLIARV